MRDRRQLARRSRVGIEQVTSLAPDAREVQGQVSRLTTSTRDRFAQEPLSGARTMTLVLRAGEQTITHALGRTPTGLVSLRGGAVSLVSGDTGTARVSAETAGEHTVLIT